MSAGTHSKSYQQAYVQSLPPSIREDTAARSRLGMISVLRDCLNNKGKYGQVRAKEENGDELAPSLLYKWRDQNRTPQPGAISTTRAS